MIARMWRGWTRLEDADVYLRYINSTGIAAYKETAGNRGAWIFRRPSGDDRVEIVTLSFWDSLEAIRGFAGDDIERAVLYPEDERYLLASDEVVVRYEVAE
jgi:heme-degrading monooxygenase HmoA